MKFKTTQERIKNEFNRINKKFFNNQLCLPQDIEIEFMDTELAAYIPFDTDWDRETLYFTDVFHSRREFQNTLAHEMIHMWQWQIQQDSACGHGPTFEYWMQVFNQQGYQVTVVA